VNRSHAFIVFLISVCALFIVTTSKIAYSQEYDEQTLYEIQHRLKELGYAAVRVDGKWNIETQNAIRKFQQDNNIPRTGRLDPETNEKLKLTHPESSKIPVQTQERVRAAFAESWNTKDVILEDGILEIVLDYNYINENGYHAMALAMCLETTRFPPIASQLTEVRILNNTKNQGWLFAQPKRCFQIVHAALKDTDNLISSNSRKFLPSKEQKRRPVREAQILLRSIPAILSARDVKEMLLKYNFFSKCISWNKEFCNPSGEFTNDFVDNADGTVLDRVTGLIWQKEGSNYKMNGSKAEAYIEDLNRTRFVGYSDWRLPTVAELASLIEREKSQKGSHISQVFSTTQNYCWSSDKSAEQVIWCVHFGEGFVQNFHETYLFSVRGVR